MLLGEAPPGRGAPGRGAPGRGACGCGRGIGRSTGCAEENGLLPTRGVRTPGLGIGPGRGPGVAPGCGACGGAACPGVGAAGPGVGGAGGAGFALAAGAAGAGGAAGAAGVAGGAGGAGVAAAAGRLGAAGLAGAPVDAPLPTALSSARSSAAPVADGTAFSAGLATIGALAGGADWGLFAAPPPADLPPPNDSRSRRATGASTVDDADLTNSPCSVSRARTSLLVTPSSLANSCTRALPATTSPVYEATAGGRASGLAMTHGHRDFTVCSCSLLPVLLRGGTSSDARSPRMCPVNR